MQPALFQEDPLEKSLKRYKIIRSLCEKVIKKAKVLATVINFIKYIYWQTPKVLHFAGILENKEVKEGCEVTRVVQYSNKFMHGIVLSSHYNTLQKHNNKERSKTMRNLTKPNINLSEYWTSMEVTPFFCEFTPGPSCLKANWHLTRVSFSCLQKHNFLW